MCTIQSKTFFTIVLYSLARSCHGSCQSEILIPQVTQKTQRAGHRNKVMSHALAQLERECEQPTPPRVLKQKVAVIGAGSDVGRIACLFLKQQPVIRTLAMYEEHPCRNVIGVATDIAHIDTCTAIEAYQGRGTMREALNEADVVMICGGCYTMPPCCNILDRQLFYQNMQFLRSSILAIANFAPEAIICIQTPPVDCNFALAKYTLMKNSSYDMRRLLGMNAINTMRANQLYCSAADLDPAKNFVPVVCGTGRCTRVPVFSACKPSLPKNDCLTRLVREADELICRVKCNYEQGHLSIGFSSARFVAGVMKGIFIDSQFLESALVEQHNPEKCYGMPICSSPVVVSQGGIIDYVIPQLDAAEKDLLRISKIDLEDMLNLGKCQALGEPYFIHDDKCPCFYTPAPCKICAGKSGAK